MDRGILKKRDNLIIRSSGHKEPNRLFVRVSVRISITEQTVRHRLNQTLAFRKCVVGECCQTQDATVVCCGRIEEEFPDDCLRGPVAGYSELDQIRSSLQQSPPKLLIAAGPGTLGQVCPVF